MSCNAKNHRPGCTCGWGGYGHIGRGSSGSSNSSKTFSQKKWLTNTIGFTGKWEYPHINKIASYSSFVNPNALCPVCKASVFFYQSPHGGRVFFDSLGPPWPKHPCTDQSSRPISISASYTRDIQSTWNINGWEPSIVESVRHKKNISFIHLSESDFVFATTNDISFIENNIPLQIREIAEPYYLISTFNEKFESKYIVAMLIEDSTFKPDPDLLRVFSIMEYTKVHNMKIPKIDQSFYENLSLETDLPFKYYVYMFFRFFNNTGIVSNIINNEVIDAVGLLEFFINIKSLGLDQYFRRVQNEKIIIPPSIIEIIKKVKHIPVLYDLISFIDGKQRYIIKDAAFQKNKKVVVSKTMNIKQNSLKKKNLKNNNSKKKKQKQKNYEDLDESTSLNIKVAAPQQRQKLKIVKVKTLDSKVEEPDSAELSFADKGWVVKKPNR